MKSGVGDSPHPRSDFAMAYDSHTDKVVLFGGNVDPSGAGGPEYTLADTWFYDYTTNKWKEMKPKVSPHGRIGHSMVYDKNIKRIVLFGGLDGYQFFNDVWIYDVNTNTWEQIAINSSMGPSPRAYAAMEFDPIRKRILLQGGLVYEQEGVHGDFWEFIITSR